MEPGSRHISRGQGPALSTVCPPSLRLPPNWTSIEHQVIRSTNRWAMDELASLRDRTLVTATGQLSGRGRLNRSWYSPPGLNLYMSAVLKPPAGGQWPGGPSSGANLGQIMALALAEALQELGLAAQLKWPNDVLIGGKKVAGILSEAGLGKEGFEGVVVGVGVNVNVGADLLAKQSLTATSLSIEAPPEAQFSPLGVGSLVIAHFEEMYARFCREGFGPWWSRWISKSGMVGHRVRVHMPDGSMVEGVVEDLSSTGELVLGQAVRYGGVNLGPGPGGGWVTGSAGGETRGEELEREGVPLGTMVISAGDVELVRSR